MNRRGFFRSMLAGVALALAGPLLARKAGWVCASGSCTVYCPHLAFHSGPGVDGVRCLYCGEKLAPGSALDGYVAFSDTNIAQDYRELPPLRGSVIRFRRDPSKVFEL